MYTRNIDYIYTLIDAYNCFRTAFWLCMYCDVYMDYKDIPDDHFSYHRNAFLFPLHYNSLVIQYVLRGGVRFPTGGYSPQAVFFYRTNR